MRIPKRKNGVPPTPRDRPPNPDGVVMFDVQPVVPLIQFVDGNVGVAAHGNFCGQNWSDGQFQPSIALGQNRTAPVDGLDYECQLHDHEYNIGGDLNAADDRFAANAWKYGAKGKLFSTLVKAQRYYRGGVKTVGEKPHFFSIINPGRMPARRKYGAKRRVKKYVKRKRSTVYRKKTSNKSRYRRSRRRTTRTRKSPIGKTSRATLKIESGSVVTDANTLYVGHGTSGYSVLLALFMSMVKKVVHAHGVTFSSFNEKTFDLSTIGYPFSLTLYWNFALNETIAWKTSGINITAVTDTYLNVAENLLAKFVTDYKGAADAVDGTRVPQFHRLMLRAGTIAVEDYEMSKIDLHTVKVHLSHSSSLRVQNRTANGTVGATTSTDVNNTNPLEGKLYFGRKGRNFMLPKYNAGGEAFANIAPEYQRGDITLGASAMSATNFLNQPPSASQVGGTKTVPFAIHPGQIMVDNWKHTQTYTLVALMSKLIPAIITKPVSPAKDYIALNLGYWRAVGLEKLVWDRTESNNVAIGYEVNQTYSVTLSSTSPSTVPFDINFTN